MSKKQKYSFIIHYHNGRKVKETFDSEKERDRSARNAREGLGITQLGNHELNCRMSRSYVEIIDNYKGNHD